jgi:hypothetical protein
MAVWSVTIKPGNPVTYVAPDQPNSPAGIVYADQGDAVFWNNTTQQDQQISLLPGNVMTPEHQSDAFVVPSDATPNSTIAYNSVTQPLATGKIIVTKKQ